MPTLEHDCNDVEELYDIIEKFLEKMEWVTQRLWETGIVMLEMNHTGTFFDHMA